MNYGFKLLLSVCLCRVRHVAMFGKKINTQRGEKNDAFAEKVIVFVFF